MAAKTSEPIVSPSEHERTREAIANLNRLQQRLAAIRKELMAKCGEEVNIGAKDRRDREIEALRAGKPVPPDPVDDRPRLNHEAAVTTEAIARQDRVVKDLVHAESRAICEGVRAEYSKRVRRIVAAMAELRAAAVQEVELRDSIQAAGWSWTLPQCGVRPTICGYGRLTSEHYLGRYLEEVVAGGIITAAEAKTAGLEPL